MERFGWPVFAPPPDTQADLMQKYGVTAEQAAGGSPDVAWLRAGDGEAHWYAAGDRLSIGIEAFQQATRVSLVPRAQQHDHRLALLRELADLARNGERVGQLVSRSC